MSRAAFASSRLASAFSVALWAGALIPALPAHGQAPEAVARARFLEGTKLYRAGRYAAAREAFRAAYRDLPSPKILFNIAAAEAALGMNALAMRHYLEARGDPSLKLTAAERAEATRMIEKLGWQVASLVIEVTQPGFEVRVGDERVGFTPLREVLFVEPGVQAVALVRDGQPLVLQRVTVRASEETTIRLQPPAALGAPPGATAGAPPAGPPSAPPTSAAGAPSGPPAPRIAAVGQPLPDGSPTGVGKPPHERGDEGRSGQALRWWGWGTLAGGIVVTGVGGLLYGLAGRDHDDMMHATSQTAFDAAKRRGQAHERSGIALFIVGGAAVVAGATLLVFGYQSRERPRALSLMPLLAPGVATVTLGGSY